jgi:acylphosphatase
LTVFVLLISIMADKFGTVLRQLREGVTNIVESDHIVILGWSQTMNATIKEFAIRQVASDRRRSIAVLSKGRETTMQQLEHWLQKGERKYVAVREGLPFQKYDLRRVSAQDARAIVIAPDISDGAEFCDRHTAAILRCLHDCNWPRDGHVIAQCMSPANLSLLEGAAGRNTELLQLSKLMGRMLVRCMTEPAWPMLLNEVFCNGSHDIRVDTWKGEVTQFHEVLRFYPNAIVIGFFCSSRKNPILCPKPHALVNPGDEVVLVTAHPAKAIGSRGRSHVKLQPPLGKDESVRVLFCGWNELGLKMLEEINNELPHATVVVLSTKSQEERETQMEELQASNSSWSLACEHQVGNPSSQVDLARGSVDEADILAFLAEDDGNSGTHTKIIDEQTVAALLAVIEKKGNSVEGKRPRCFVQVLNKHTEEHLGGFVHQLACSRDGSNIGASQLLSIREDRRTTQIHGTELIGNLTVINSVSLAARILGVVTANKKLFSVVNQLPNLIVEERTLKTMPHCSDRVSFWDAGAQFSTTMESCVTLGWRCQNATDGCWELNPLHKEEGVLWEKNEDRLLTLRYEIATDGA